MKMASTSNAREELNSELHNQVNNEPRTNTNNATSFSRNLSDLENLELNAVNGINLNDWNETFAEEVPANRAVNRRRPTISYNTIFSLGTKQYSLTTSGSKILVIGISYRRPPDLSIKFRLHDTFNNESIEFSKKMWSYIMENKLNIRQSISRNEDKYFFRCNNIYVEVKRNNRHWPYQGFFGMRNGLDAIYISSETFDRFTSLENEINNLCIELTSKRQNVSRRLKLFIDTVFSQIKKNNMDQNNENNLLSNPELNATVANAWQSLGQFLPETNTINID